jgi:hypothetical protein
MAENMTGNTADNENLPIEVRGNSYVLKRDAHGLRLEFRGRMYVWKDVDDQDRLEIDGECSLHGRAR